MAVAAVFLQFTFSKLPSVPEDFSPFPSTLNAWFFVSHFFVLLILNDCFLYTSGIQCLGSYIEEKK